LIFVFVILHSFLFYFYSKTIVHAGSKFSSGEASKALENMLNKDKDSTSDVSEGCLSDVTNTSSSLSTSTDPVTQRDKPVSKKQRPVIAAKEVGAKQAQSKKRATQTTHNQSSQPEKKKKTDQSKSCRRKLLPQVKGQQALTKFFKA